MKLLLCSSVRFRASHRLEERENVHEHVWEVEVGITGPIREGRIISLPILKQVLKSAVTPLEGTLLNENRALDSATQSFPTCENLVVYLYERLCSSLRREVSEAIELQFVDVRVLELDGSFWGRARLSQ